jgi:hypothetical protein
MQHAGCERGRRLFSFSELEPRVEERLCVASFLRVTLRSSFVSCARLLLCAIRKPGADVLAAPGVLQLYQPLFDLKVRTCSLNLLAIFCSVSTAWLCIFSWSPLEMWFCLASKSRHLR